ncbi:CocE/NonD family hydrolase [Gemmobacter sp. 24YEA27]|uniref:CocE/NonD family hydrolase n=1 Tax=Gemmobacter sp. 24YEA27 TaxID=3040672 RepID=UPI0024B36ADD|nr:CocE/NonD family hydrolase [Gemmobacter sp. 24YEA27]
MRMRRAFWVTLAGLSLAGGAALVISQPLRAQLIWQIQAGAPDLSDVGVAMPDGLRLATDVYLPAPGLRGTGFRGPAVLMRLPYGKRSYGEIRFWVNILLPEGYAVVVQDMRGRGNSDGVFAPWPNEGADGAATLDWITAQGWSDGAVGTLGCSALGESQLMLAALNHPAHRAMVPMGAGGAAGTLEGRHTYFGAFEGGIFQLASGIGWFGTAGEKTPGRYAPEGGDLAAALQTLPIIGAVRRLRHDPTDYEAFLEHFGDTAWWNDMGYISPEDRPTVPAFYIDSWYDPSIGGTLALQRASRLAGAETQTLITPGTHCSYLGADEPGMVGDLPLAPQGRAAPVGQILAFLAAT